MCGYAWADPAKFVTATRRRGTKMHDQNEWKRSGSGSLNSKTRRDENEVSEVQHYIVSRNVSL